MSPTDEFDQAKQSIALMTLIEEMETLNKLVANSISDEETTKEIDAIQLELEAFKKVLKEDREYTEQQIEELLQKMRQFRDYLFAMPSPSQVAQDIIEHYSSLNGGESPIEGLAVDIKFDKAFEEKMNAIDKQCGIVLDKADKLKALSPGREHSLFEKFANVCSSIANGFKFMLNATISIAKEVQFQAKSTLVSMGYMEDTDDFKLEAEKRRQQYLERAQARSEKRIAELEQRVADRKVGEDARKEAEGRRKPKIFR